MTIRECIADTLHTDGMEVHQAERLAAEIDDQGELPEHRRPLSKWAMRRAYLPSVRLPLRR
jgi:hypothetical protein